MQSSAHTDSELEQTPPISEGRAFELTGQLTKNLTQNKLTLTRLALRLAMGASLIGIAARLLLPSDSNRQAAISILAGCLLLAGAHLMIKFGHLKWAIYLLSYPLVLLICYVLCTGGGLQSGAAVFLLPLLVFTSATLEKKGFLCFSMTALVSVLSIACLDSAGSLPKASLTPTSVAWLQLSVALGTSALMLRGVMNSLRAAHRDADAATQQHEDTHSRYVKAQKLEPVAQLANGIAHDFNNLLGVIANVSSSIRLETQSSSEVAELLDDLDEATTRASMMTGQLLAFSRKRALAMEAINLDEFVESLTPLLARLLGDEILVACCGTTKSLTVQADRGQLEQVMLNLAVNARDAMPRGGRLTLELGSSHHDSVYLAVKDTGVGIAEPIREQIFAAFFTTKATGTGLGLATVSDIVRQLKGSIELESELDKGTTFRIVLPAFEAPATSSRRSLSRIRTLQRSAHVLLAEDHELMRRATQRILEQAGYTVTSVVNGREAMALIHGGSSFDVLLTDMSMPHLSGLDLVERLAAMQLALPTLFMSGNAGRLPERLYNMHFPTRFLAKPFAQEDLIDALEKLMSQPRSGASEC